MTIDLDGPFRGSSAVAAGALTAGVLRGPRFRRLYPDIYVPARQKLDLTVWSVAAYLLVAGRGVLAGWSAAELLRASCAPPGAPATVLMAPGQQRARCRGLVVRRGQVRRDETTWRVGCGMTDPVRTAFDLARWAPTLVEKVVAVDAMETRIRLALVLAGLPAPAVQHRVVGFGRSHRLDLAYPDVLLAIEYDGAEHREADRARQDLEREAVLTRLGWTVLRFDARTVLGDPARVAATVRAELARRGMLIAG